MKRSTLFLVPLSVVVMALTCAFIQASDTCDTKKLKDEAKAALDPFKYDSGKVTRLTYKKKAQLKEIEVPLFIGETYKVVFNTAGISRDVTINVYSKDKESKNREPLFTAKATGAERIFTYEPKGRRTKLYVDYDLPVVNDSVPPAECLVMMLGYK